MTTVRFGVVGTSAITEWFIKAGKKLDGFEIKAVYSRSIEKAEEFGKKHGAELFFDDLYAMSKCDEIDAIYIASPNFMHKEQAILCMNNGKNVLCEKPFATNKRDAEEMIKCARENNVLLMEEMRLTCTPNFQSVKNNLGKLGTIRRYSANYCQYSSRYDKFKEGIVLNAFKRELSNGALMDIGVYCIHPMVNLFGRPNSLKANAVKLSTGVDGEGSIILEYDDMLADIRYSKITHSNIPTEIQGEDGSIIVDKISTFGDVRVEYRKGGVEDITAELEVEKDERFEVDSIYCAVKEFMKSLREGKKESDINTLENTLIVMEIMDEVRKQIDLVYPADEN